MYRVSLMLSLVVLLPGLCRAEPFTVWADSGDIWARNGLPFTRSVPLS
jgi:hypothetical protein